MIDVKTVIYPDERYSEYPVRAAMTIHVTDEVSGESIQLEASALGETPLSACRNIETLAGKVLSLVAGEIERANEKSFREEIAAGAMEIATYPAVIAASQTGA